MTQSRLNDTLVALDLGEQSMHVGNHILGDVGKMRRDDSPEKDSPQPGGGFDGQMQMPEGKSSGRGAHPRVVHLGFRKRRI